MAKRLVLLVLCLLSLSAICSAIPSWLARSVSYHANLHREEDPQGPPAQWFTQKLDHFNHQEKRTWQQRYYVNDTFWNADLKGPIFLMVGGEGAISSAYVTAFVMANFAQRYGALMVAVEHRFYGASQPLPDLSNDNLVYLSSQQALADLSYFIQHFKAEMNAQDSPVVTFGGSYPGNLAAWFRLKYPHLTVGSIASSAPVQATLDFFQYLDVVETSLDYFTGLQCDSNIRTATQKIQQLLQTPQGKKQLQSQFSICSPLESQNDVATFISNLMGNWMGVVQYNDEGGNTIDINYLCKIMNNGSDAYSNYIAINNLFLELQGQSCLDCSYADSISQLKNINSSGQNSVGIRQWTYQTCTEFGYFQSTDSSNQPFGNLVPVSFYTQMCTDAFGFSWLPSINETNDHYGGNKPNGATNIVFVNGSIDPWHALGVTSDLSESLRAVFILGTAHCADMLPARPNDPQSLSKAQQEIIFHIGEFLEHAPK